MIVFGTSIYIKIVSKKSLNLENLHMKKQKETPADLDPSMHCEIALCLVGNIRPKEDFDSRRGL